MEPQGSQRSSAWNGDTCNAGAENTKVDVDRVQAVPGTHAGRAGIQQHGLITSGRQLLGVAAPFGGTGLHPTPKEDDGLNISFFQLALFNEEKDLLCWAILNRR